MTAALQSALAAAGPGHGALGEPVLALPVVCALVYAAVVVALIWAVVRRRERGGAPLPYPDHAQERRLNHVIGGATALTVLLLVVLIVASFVADRSLADLSAQPNFEVKVIGHQWWWEVNYQDLNPSHSFTTANEIHVPVGVPVKVTLTSPDVIHSFWVPSLNGKTDLIPGRENVTTIQADRPGTYRGQCAEYCGLQHAHMALLVVAEPKEAFEAWRARQIRARPRARRRHREARSRRVPLRALRDVPQDPGHGRRRQPRARPHPRRGPPDPGRRHDPEHARLPGSLDRGPAARQAGQPDADHPDRRRPT